MLLLALERVPPLISPAIVPQANGQVHEDSSRCRRRLGLIGPPWEGHYVEASLSRRPIISSLLGLHPPIYEQGRSAGQ
jgi:hypothetical protein